MRLPTLLGAGGGGTTLLELVWIDGGAGTDPNKILDPCLLFGRELRRFLVIQGDAGLLCGVRCSLLHWIFARWPGDCDRQTQVQ